MLTAIKICCPANNEENVVCNGREHYRLYTCMSTSNNAFHAYLQDTEDHRAHFNFEADICSTSNQELFELAIKPLLDNLLLLSSSQTLSRCEENEQVELSQNICSSSGHDDGRALQLTIIVDGSSCARQDTLTNSEDGIILLTIKHLLSLCQHQHHAKHEINKETVLNRTNEDNVRTHELSKESKCTVNTEHVDNEINASNSSINGQHIDRLSQVEEELCSIDGIYLSVYSLNSVTNTFDDALYEALVTRSNAKNTNSEIRELTSAKAHHINKCQGDNIIPVTVVEDKEECFTSIEGGMCEFINDESMLPKIMNTIQSSFASTHHEVFTLIATLHDTSMESVGTSASTLEFCDNNFSDTELESIRVDKGKNVHNVERKDNNKTWNITIQFVSLAVAEEVKYRHVSCNGDDTCLRHESQESTQHKDSFYSCQDNDINSNNDIDVSKNDKCKTAKADSVLNVNANNLQSVRFSLNSAAMLLSCTRSTSIVNFKSNDPLLFLLKPALLMTQPAMYISCFTPFASTQSYTKEKTRKEIKSQAEHGKLNLYAQTNNKHNAIISNTTDQHNYTTKNGNEELEQSANCECCANSEAFVTAFHVAQLAERVYNIRNAPWCSSLKYSSNIISNVVHKESECNTPKKHCGVPTNTSSIHVKSSNNESPHEKEHVLHQKTTESKIDTESPQGISKEEKYTHKYNVHDGNVNAKERISEVSRKQEIGNIVVSNVGLVHTPACNIAKLSYQESFLPTSHTTQKHNQQNVLSTKSENNKHNKSQSDIMKNRESKPSLEVCKNKVASCNKLTEKMTTLPTAAAVITTMNVAENCAKEYTDNRINAKNTQTFVAHTKESTSNEKHCALTGRCWSTKHNEVSCQDSKSLLHLLEMIDYQNSEIDEHLHAENKLWQRCMQSENALKQSKQECARLRSELIELRHRYVYK